MSVASTESVAEAENRVIQSSIVNGMRLGDESDKNVQPTRRTIAIAPISTRQCTKVYSPLICQTCIDVCHWLSQRFLQMGRTGRASGTQPIWKA